MGPLMDGLGGLVQNLNFLDVAQFAVQVGQPSALSADLKAFTESEPSVRRKFAEVRDLYRDIRRIVGAGGQIVVQFLLPSESDELPENDLQKRVYDYLVKNKTRTRLGEVIEATKNDAEDMAFQTLLDLTRIVAEHVSDDKFGLPWLADDETTDAQKQKILEERPARLMTTSPSERYWP